MGIKKEPVSSAYRFSVVYSGFIVSILGIISAKNEKSRSISLRLCLFLFPATFPAAGQLFCASCGSRSCGPCGLPRRFRYNSYPKSGRMRRSACHPGSGWIASAVFAAPLRPALQAPGISLRPAFYSPSTITSVCTASMASAGSATFFSCWVPK